MDSSGKLPTGLIRSTLSSFGNYDECLKSRSSVQLEASFQGKYCSVDIFPFKRPNNVTRSDFLDLGDVPAIDGFPFVASFCIPSTCDELQLRTILEQGEGNFLWEKEE